MVTSTETDVRAPQAAKPAEDDDREFFRGLLYAGLIGVVTWTLLLVFAFV